MYKKLRIITSLIIMVSVLSCSKPEDDPIDPIKDPKDTTGTGGGGGGGGETGLNINPDFSLFFNGQKIEFSKMQVDYGSKTYFFGHDKSGRFALDIAIPMPKGVTASGKTFTIDDDQYTGMGFYMDDIDQKWYLEGGQITVTKNLNNTMSGTFSAKALLLDYTDPNKIIRLDSTSITNGVFNNIKVKG